MRNKEEKLKENFICAVAELGFLLTTFTFKVDQMLAKSFDVFLAKFPCFEGFLSLLGDFDRPFRFFLFRGTFFVFLVDVHYIF